ncbi:hypothetical protein [Micromonospora parva]|uniref:hypothetical protein n=1 Tax=Micromonospora parva TaxID=1464048 RepID=UPI0033C93D7A
MAVVKSVGASTRIRTLQLNADDVRSIEAALGGGTTTWRVGAQVADGKSYPRTVFSESSSLDELIAIAPKGRLAHFEVQHEDGKEILTLSVPGPNARLSLLTFEGPGEDVPDYFREIAFLLQQDERRGQKLHYVGLFCGPVLAITVPLGILDTVGRLGLFYDETRPVGNVSSAIISAVVVFLFLAPVCAGIWSWTTASFVALRPLIDAASLVRRMRDRVVSAAAWFRSLYRADELAEQKMLFATVTAMFFGIGAFIVAVIDLVAK